MPLPARIRSCSRPQALVIADADVVTPEGVRSGVDVIVRGGVIVHVGRARRPPGARIVAAGGLTLLPGFVDIHSDALETAIQPRPGGLFPTAMALRELDRSLVACGITTIFHAVSFCDHLQTGLRNSRNCARLIEEIRAETPRLRARTRVHLRYEITETATIPLVESLIDAGRVDFFSLMDHTPGQGQFVDERQFRIYYGKVRGKAPEELDRLVADRIAMRRTVADGPLFELVARCRRHGIRVASHDDDTEAKVDWNQRLGVGLAEFPVTLAAARRARKHGMHVSLGAPNILRGGSATGNLSAREAVAADCGTVICSDYAPMSLIHAGAILVREGLVDPAGMSRMLSGQPADAAGIGATTGAIEEGKAADLVLAAFDGDDWPDIRRTFVEGREVYAAG